MICQDKLDIFFNVCLNGIFSYSKIYDKKANEMNKVLINPEKLTFISNMRTVVFTPRKLTFQFLKSLYLIYIW